MSNDQMIMIIECFIHHRAGKQVRISRPRTPQQYLLLAKMYENCIGWFVK